MRPVHKLVARKLYKRLDTLKMDRASRGLLQYKTDGKNSSLRTIVDSRSMVDVSLTSYGDRILTVHRTILSIGQGELKPRRIILWLDDEKAFKNLPSPLKALQHQGLVVRLTENLGPHTKYYPYVNEYGDDGQCLVTADDDIYYSKDWLKDLWLARCNTNYQNLVFCHRAHRIRMSSDGNMLSYLDWDEVWDKNPSVLNFATGVSGVLYNPEFVALLKKAGKGFLDKCPKADDIWLHYMAILNGYKIMQVRSFPREFPEIEGTQQKALHQLNVLKGENDSQIRRTYNNSALSILREYAV